MSKLTIITVPDDEKILRTKSDELAIEKIKTPEMQKFFDNLKETMYRADGVGLAAPQVGFNIRIIAININPSDNGNQSLVLINPRVIKKSWLGNVAEEGCLSIPGVWGMVKRPNKIIVNYTDANGQTKIIKGNKLISRILCHEIDHLNGILFTDKAKNIIKK